MQPPKSEVLERGSMDMGRIVVVHALSGDMIDDMAAKP